MMEKVFVFLCIKSSYRLIKENTNTPIIKWPKNKIIYKEMQIASKHMTTILNLISNHINVKYKIYYFCL